MVENFGNLKFHKNNNRSTRRDNMDFSPKIAKILGFFERKFGFWADFQTEAIWWYSCGYDLKTPLDLDWTEFWYGNLRRFFWHAKCGFKVNSGVKSGQVARHVTVQGHSYDQHLNLQKSWIPRFWSKYRLQGPLLTLTLPINEPKVCSRFLRWSRFFKSISRISRNTRFKEISSLVKFTPVLIGELAVHR